MKAIVVIPAYNEEKNIASVISRIPKELDIVVINNASTDNTVWEVKKTNTPIIMHEKNLGKAQSLVDGFNYAFENNYDFVLLMDGDGEHDPADIPQFLEKIKTRDFVIGQRTYYRSFSRVLVNKWCNFWFNLVLPKIDDVQCGFRIIRTDLLKKLDISAMGFQIEINMLLEAVKNKARIDKVFIKTKPRKGTNLTVRDYIKINNFFDRWVLKNHKHLNINHFKRLFLVVFANLGLLLFKWFE